MHNLRLKSSNFVKFSGKIEILSTHHLPVSEIYNFLFRHARHRCTLDGLLCLVRFYANPSTFARDARNELFHTRFYNDLEIDSSTLNFSRTFKSQQKRHFRLIFTGKIAN